MNQSISQSVSQSVNQSINQSVSQSVSQSVNQSINRSIAAADAPVHLDGGAAAILPGAPAKDTPRGSAASPLRLRKSLL
jgi:hypothetical protein